MADLMDVAPTRGNLLRLRGKLEQLRDGHALLDRKRETLIQELMATIDEAEELEWVARERSRAGYAALQLARVRMGLDELRPAALAATAEVEVQVEARSVMGVEVPVVRARVEPAVVPYGLDGRSAALDQARGRWLEVARLLGELTEKVSTVWRLAIELRKTQRRVNALESTIIPRHEAAVRFIEGTLAEAEREEIVHAKKVKAQRRRNEGRDG